MKEMFKNLPYKRIVIKLGTNLLTSGKEHLDLDVFKSICKQISEIKSQNIEIIIVSSGAVASGKGIVENISKITSKNNVAYRQMLAAIGQPKLMLTFDEYFKKDNIIVAQALLSRSDLSSRSRYLNLRTTLEKLLSFNVIPIVNENDVVAVDELSGEFFGDNDRLSAMVANSIDADLLILLGDTNGLYTADPHIDSNAKLIPLVENIDENIENLAHSSHNTLGRGGMISKLAAAKISMDAGIPLIIASGNNVSLRKIVIEHQNIGTIFKPKLSRVESRKRWILTGRSEKKGTLSIDDGAYEAIKNGGNSLLPAGIKNLTGSFYRGDIVEINNQKNILGWGITSYDSKDIMLIKGKQSSEIHSMVDIFYGEEIIHRNNMVIA
ncbi:MAG: glutamate 5-kinase [Chloroflexi bacterium]|nr:glutamate 5-kinase [Chloroflexota bacterium]